jgi:hypothetical protein
MDGHFFSLSLVYFFLPFPPLSMMLRVVLEKLSFRLVNAGAPHKGSLKNLIPRWRFDIAGKEPARCII